MRFIWNRREKNMQIIKVNQNRKASALLGMFIFITVLSILLLVSLTDFQDYLRHLISPPPKVNRLLADQRSLATAIEAYYLDYRSLPSMVPLRDFTKKHKELKAAGGWELFTINPACLTTPIPYYSSMPPDPHSPDKKMPFVYYTDGEGWILFSPGFDGMYEIIPWRDYDSQKELEGQEALFLKKFDATNGTKSRGDVWRTNLGMY